MTISNRQSFRNVPLLFYHWIGERTTPPVLDCVILEHWSTQKAVPNPTSVTNKYQYYTANCFLQQLHFEFSEYWSLLRRDIPTSRARRAVPVLPWARTNSSKAGDHWISGQNSNGTFDWFCGLEIVTYRSIISNAKQVSLCIAQGKGHGSTGVGAHAEYWEPSYKNHRIT